MVKSTKRPVKYRLINDKHLRLLKGLMRQKLGEIKQFKNRQKQLREKTK
jgi:hypothetical protein